MRRSLLNKRILPKPLRQALVLITLLLLPRAAWGQDPTSYNLTVAGVEVTSANASNVLGNDFKSVSYDPTSYTLTLKGANFVDVISVGEGIEELKVHLVGYNNIGTSTSVFEKASTTKLTFTTSTTFPGSLHLNSALPTDNIFYENGLSYNDGDKVIEKNLDNTTVTPFTGYVGYVDSEGSNAFIYSGNPDFFASYATAPIARSVLVSPKGTNTYLSMWSTNFSHISLINKIMVQFDWGTCTNTDVTVQVRGMKKVEMDYVYDDKTYSDAISLSTANADGIVVIPLTGEITSDNFELYFSSDEGFSFYPLNFAFISTEKYDITVAGILVSELNATNIKGPSITGGKVTYDNSTQTLTLNNATIESTNGIVWEGESDLTIKFSGNNIIYYNFSEDPNSDEGFCILYSGNNTSTTLNLTTADDSNSSTLTLTPKFDPSDSNNSRMAISGFNTVQIDKTNGWGMYYTDDYSEADPENPTAGEEIVLLKDYLGIAVAGVLVTSANKDDILGDGKVSFSPETVVIDNPGSSSTPATLTLNGATIDFSGNNGYPVVSSIENLTVKLIGKNEATLYTDCPNFIKYSGESSSAQLTFETEWSSDENGLYSLGDLTINGAEGRENIADGYTISNNLEESNSYIDPDYANEETSSWRYSIVNDQSVTSVKVWYLKVYDLWIGSGRVISTNLEAGQSGGFLYDPVKGQICATATNSYPIKSSMEELVISVNGPNCSITPSSSSTCAITFQKKTDEQPRGKLKFVVAEDAEENMNKFTIRNDGGAISGFSSVTFEDPLILISSAPASETWDETITEFVISDEVFYNLWVGGVQVSSGNASDIFNTTEAKDYATASFDKTTNTLTLKEANIQVNGKNGIESGLATLTVIISGTNSIDCQGTETVAFKGVGTDNAIAFKLDTSDPGKLDIQCSNNPIIDGLEVEYEDGIGLIALESDYYSIGELQKPEINSSASDEGISVALILPSGDSYIGSTMYYSITYNDEEVENIPYSTAFSMSKPGIVTAYLVPSLGGRSGNSVGKYYGYPDAPYTMGVGDEITPAIYPAIEDNDYIGLNGSTSSNENIATFTYSDGVVKALATGTVTLTAILTGSDMSFTVLNPKESSEQSNYNYPVTFSVVVGENLNTIFAANQNFGTWYNTSDKTYKVPDGITAYIITGVDGDKVTIAETKVIPPNAPILMEKGENAKAFTYTEATDTDGSFPSGNILNYTTTDKEAVEASKLYVLYNGQFVKVTAGTKILANHCYLDLGGTSAGTRGYYNIGDGEGTTAIREVIYEGVNSEKWADGTWHDLQGRKFTTKPTKPGLYILNGKKIVIK